MLEQLNLSQPLAQESQSETDFLIPRRYRVALGSILVAALLARLWYGSFVIDDAYITFRYAQNLADGAGLVYNPDGRHILGTTTPLFTLWLSLLYRVGFSFEGASLWTSLLCDWVTIGLLYGIGRKLNLTGLGLAAGALVALWPDYITYSNSGMETSLYIALLLGSFYLYLRRDFGWAGLTMGLMILTRPDALIMCAVLFGHYLLRERRIPWRMGLALLPLPLIWSAFALFYFGSPISQSLIAKASTVTETPTQSLVQLLIFLNQTIKPALTILAAIGIYAIIREKRYAGVRLLLVWWVLYCVVFISRGAFHFFPWYYTPLLPFYFLAALIGLASLSKLFAINPRRELIQIAFIVLALLATGLLTILNFTNKQSLIEENLSRTGLYRDIALRLLVPQVAPGEQVAANEIGTLGYFCKCQMYDLAGLITPEAVNRPELEALAATRPAFIVVYNNHLHPETLNSDWLKQNYETLEVYDIKVFGQKELYVFRRRGLLLRPVVK